MAIKWVLANESTAAKRRVYFHLVQTDGITPATGEAAGQPQISSDGAAWTNTGIGTLTAIGNGRYYADLTQTAVQTVGTHIETRYKSASTAECPGDSVECVGFNPYDAQRLGLTALPAADFGTAGGFSIGCIASNTAQAGATQNVTLAAGEPSTTDIYAGALIHIWSGTGAGQARIGIAYNGTTKVLSVDCPWAVVPDNTSKYRILPFRLAPMDGNLGVVVQALEPVAIAGIWGYQTSNLTLAGSIGKFIVDNANTLNGTNAVETGYSVVGALRIILAASAGNVSGGGSTSVVIKNITNTKDRINATVDAVGNRSVTMLDAV